MKIVLVLCDSLRYDHLGGLGLKDVDTPELDALASDSVFFERAYVGSFPTVPQRYDMLTGVLGFPHRGWEPLKATDISLAEILLDNGYITQLITDTNEILRHEQNYNRGYIGHHLERGQERDIYFTKMNEPLPRVIPDEKARHSYYFGDHTQADLATWVNNHWRWEEDRFPPRISQMARKWLEWNYKAEDFLLHLDFFDPHEPWDPPDYLVEKYNPGYTGLPMTMPNYGLAEVFTEDELKDMNARYKGEVEMVSKWVGFAIRKMKDIGIYDESLIIFTSDHGILLGEHNCTGKLNITKTDPRGPWPLYHEVIHVPLFIKLPGEAHKGKRIDELVQPVDIFATILELAGIDLNNPLPGKAPLPAREINAELKGILHGRKNGLNKIQAKSLVPLWSDASPKWDREYIYSSQRAGFCNENFSFNLTPEPDSTMFWTTITSKEHALLIGGREEEKPRLFNIIKDPKQADDIYQKEPEIAKRMVQAFCKYLESLGMEERIRNAYMAKLK